MKHERTCAICGTTYEYCNNCPKYDSLPRWMFMFHDENCKKIYDAVNDYKAKVISVEEAKENLSKLNVSINLVPAIKSIVDEIMASGTEGKKNEEVKVEERRQPERRDKQNFQKERFRKYNSNNK